MKIKLLTDNILVRQIAGLLQFKKSILMPLMFLLVYGNVWGQTSTLQLAAGSLFGTTSGSTKASTSGTAVTWTVTTTAGAIQNTWNSSNYLGQQFGTGATAWTGTFTAPAISGATITKIDVRANTGGSATLAASVGGTSFTPASQSVTKNSSATDANLATYSFTGSKAGAITITVSGTSAAFYLNRITITYSTSPTLTATTITGASLNTTYGTASAGVQSSANGSLLTGDITVTAATGFEVSKTSASTGFTNNFTIPAGSNNIWVRAAANKTAGNSGTGYAAGTIVATLSGGGAAADANITTATSVITVSKKALSLTVNPRTITYGETVANVTAAANNSYVLSGFVNGETSASGLTGTPTYTTTYAGNENAGAAGETVSYNSGLSATNYTFSNVSGVITIQRANTTSVTVNNGSPYTYIPGTPQGPSAVTVVPSASNGTVSYLYSGTEYSGNTYTASATRPTNAGTYSVVASVAQSTNYEPLSSSSTPFTINKANSTVTVTGDSFYTFNGNPHGPVTYDHTGSAGSVTFHYTGINGTDYPENTTRPTAVGSYKAVATLAADNNYNDAVSADFNYQITSVAVPEITSPLTWSTTYGVAATPYTVVASNNPTSFGVSGLPAGLNYSSLTNEITGTPTAAPGDYNVSLTATNEGGTSDPVTLVVSVDKKTVTVSDASVANKVYNGNNTATLTGTADGFVSGDDVSLVLSAHFDDTSGNVGQAKPVTSTSTLTGTKADYYNLIQPTGLSADITKATPTVTATGTTAYTYNGSPQGPASATVSPSAAGTATYSYSGTESEGAVYGPSSTRPVNAGTYYMVATVEESANYNAASSSDYEFTIAKANQALTGFGSNITKLSTDAPFNLPAAVTTTGGQTVTYAITDMPNAGVATVTGNTVTITGIGTTGITAHADATPNYNAYDASINLTVNFNTALAPTASAATNILGTGFTANWASVFGATDYELDVYTKSTVNNQVEVFNATFSDLNGTGGNDGAWSGNIGTNSLSSYTNTGWTFSSSGGAKECIKSGTGSNPGVVTTPVLSSLSGNAVLTFRAAGFSTDNTVLSVSITGGGSISGNSTFSLVNSSFSSYTVNIVGGTSSTKLTFSSSSGGQRFFIDDIRVVSGSVITTTTSIDGAPFTISAQNPQPTNYSNTLVGLNRNTQYYYVVRAINGSNETGNSNEIAVKTTNAVVWDGSGWSNSGVGPDETLDAEITGNYSIASGFEAKNLTISDTGLLTIQPNQGVTINGDITMPDDKIIIESDGSLVQTKLTNGNSDNKAIAKRTVTMRTADFTFWSSPLAGQALLNTTNGNADNSTGGFSEGTPNSRTYHYNEPDDTFRATSDASFVPGKGYAIRGKSTYGADLSPDELGFRGNLNNGNISIQVKKSKNTTKNGETYEHGYNMIGNPYPSHIDFIDFYNLDKGDGEKNSDVIFGKAWFWSNITVAPSQQGGSSYNANNYAILSLAGSSPATGIDTGETSGNPMPNEFIKVGQGFIVQVRVAPPTNNTPILKTLKFDNSIRTNDNTGHFYNSKSNSTIDRYWVKLTSPNSVVNTILVAHMNAATDAYDADYDAELLSVGDDSFYSKLNAQKLQIQARKRFQSNEDVISVGTKYAVNGTYKISLGQKEGVFSGSQNVYLKDNLLNKTVNLSEGDYAFQAVKGTDDTRFEIVYKDSGVLGADTVKKSDFTVYKDGNSYVINSSKKLGRVDVYDAAGRLLKTFKTNDSYLRIDGSGLSNGVYVIKAENSGDIKTKKIIK